MARHDSPQTSTGRRALAALATAGVALGAGAGTAAAAAGEPAVDVVRTRPTSIGQIDPQAGLQGALGSLSYVTGAVSGLKPNPLAGTGVDPLDNGVGTQLADFRPLTSQMLTGPVAQAQSIGSIPVVGDVTKVLGG
ncbi:hypothetical protein KMT30_34840 [Streptomyces sp. IBSBF 2953]|uniref:hypothetical protein n=1 Tax=Streptomyces TaxID=1883 RepID=UPI00211A0B03|nr:hypothetical protein [Streptomyces scabiei]MCQ9184130.1 hypothetical protein [Streptomyces hayashii]MDX3117049.1 hypothetical protein [Streptomyces scabiei]